MAQTSCERAFPLHADAGFLAQPSRDLVLDPARQVSVWRFLLFGPTAQGSHRCFHQRLQQKRRAIRLDQSQSASAARQRPPYQRIVIPGTSLQLSKEIGIRQASAWFMLHRIREACGPDLKKLRGIIEIDECFVGGIEANKHEHKKLKAGRGTVGKTPVLGMRERGGRTVAKTIANTDAGTVQSEIHRHVEAGSA